MADIITKDDKAKGNTAYDFFKEKEWVFTLVGYGTPKNILDRIYTSILTALFVFFIVMAFHTMYLAGMKGKIQLIISAIHVWMVCTFFVWGTLTRVFTRESMDRARELALTGFYHYPDEELDEEQMKMLTEGVAEIRSDCNKVMYAMIVGVFMNLVVFPLSQYANVPEDVYEDTVDIATPYLPHPFHTPFSTRSIPGFLLAYFLTACLQIGINGITVTMSEFFVGSYMQLNIQMKLLNHSIRNVHKRAYLLHAKQKKGNGLIGGSPDGYLWENPDYQECLYKCLRSNIEHHQLLLKYRDSLMPYCGSSLTLVVLIASLTFATSLALVVMDPPPNLLMHYTGILIGEQFYAFFLCYVGEQVMQQGNDLFESLYDAPWINCNKRFTTILRIFMAYNKEPMKVRCLVLEVIASLETYGLFLSTMYKLANLIREFQ